MPARVRSLEPNIGGPTYRHRCIRRGRLDYFDWEKKDNISNVTREQVEVASVIGDVALSPSEEPTLYIHVVVGKWDGTAFNGHLQKARVRPALEVTLNESPAHLQKVHDPDALRGELDHERSRIRLTMVQLPAVNTPQFDWARSRMPRKLQPVPPIYQPEAIAKEIVRAALEAPRELWIGRSALKAIFGAMLLPLLGDRILASEGYSGQMTAELAQPDRRDNLFEPVPSDPGVHGRFDRSARRDVAGFDPVRLRAGIACALIVGVAGLVAIASSRRA